MSRGESGNEERGQDMTNQEMVDYIRDALERADKKECPQARGTLEAALIYVARWLELQEKQEKREE